MSTGKERFAHFVKSNSNITVSNTEVYLEQEHRE